MSTPGTRQSDTKDWTATTNMLCKVCRMILSLQGFLAFLWTTSCDPGISFLISVELALTIATSKPLGPFCCVRLARLKIGVVAVEAKCATKNGVSSLTRARLYCDRCFSYRYRRFHGESPTSFTSPGFNACAKPHYTLY